MQKYILIDHTADIGIDVFGATLPELFSNAGFALFDIITDISKVKLTLTRKLKITGIDKEQLLVNWLSELLYLHEVENLLFGKFTVLSIQEDQLHASVRGETLTENKQAIKTEIKAVTYHSLSIRKEAHLWKARVIFDV
ncbi:MAG: archease [Candidatus Brocadiaceae bacterium]|nr:archease [Candidatus Brocadiaceae bacterium]